MAQTKKILLVDDSQIFLMGLRMAFQAADWVDGIFEARNQDQALKMLESHDDISLAIIDVCLEKRADGLELIRQIKDKHPAVKTLVLSQYKNPDFICRAIVSGAYAYIAKDSEADVIVSASKNVADGCCIFFGDTISKDLLTRLFGNADNIKAGKPHQLSVQELAVLQYAASGYGNAQIATVMNISSNTVESYKERIKNKLGYDTIIECVAFAVSNGLIGFKD